ncbi:MAG: hypothetical protein RL172_259 [Bacteroidota bacterium]
MHKFISLMIITALVSCNNNSNQSTESKETPAANDEQHAAVTTSKYPERVYWGDQHLHTAWSADAGAAGTTIGPEDALRFAMGEQIKNNSGQPTKLDRPLDWLCVSDHSDGMGVLSFIIGGDPELMKEPLLKQWHDGITSGDPKRMQQAKMEMVHAQSTETLPKIVMDSSFARTVWDKNIEIVEKYNSPGKFTAFIAYEWTSNYGGGNNLHRNIIYRGNGQEARQMLPATTFVSADPESLWKWMQAYEDKTAGKILAIPHNGNLSNGLMFSLTTLAGKPISKEYAEARNKWEPLFEVTQVKGTSEAHPSISPTDEFANFELWDKGNLGYQKLKTPDMLKTEYYREALKDGIKLEQQLGINPFKYGSVGGTDDHTGITSADEDNFNGKFKMEEPSAERWNGLASKSKAGIQKSWEYSGSGWTGVWATANTREALWDAMKRRETYATTGPRMSVRVFGGFDFSTDDLNASNMIERGYTKGVPMGGDLYTAPAGKKLSLIIDAVKDPIGANLDRVQVIKGWVDAKGNKQEKIYEVVWGDADKRKLNAKGKLPAVGNTVNLATCEVANTIGATELKTVWTDPDFDPALSAVYYVRVLEIPTPRWTAYDAMRYKIKMDANVPMTTQERCYTSPIWYTPKK